VRAAALTRAPGGGPAVAFVSRGTTRATKGSGTSQTPAFTRTGASRTIGVPSTTTCAQFRVNVTTWPGVRRYARMLLGVASSRVLRLAATRSSSTYRDPSCWTIAS
jgi:hypothetical protein